jgi:hypothetical protein
MTTRPDSGHRSALYGARGRRMSDMARMARTPVGGGAAAGRSPGVLVGTWCKSRSPRSAAKQCRSKSLTTSVTG